MAKNKNISLSDLEDRPESHEQMAVIAWRDLNARQYPGLRWLYAIPNGDLRDKRVAARLKAEGVTPGVCDLFLPVPKGRVHGLYVEIKRRRGGKISKAQAEFISFVNCSGYLAVVCKGSDEAIGIIKQYLEGVSDGDRKNQAV